MIPIKNHWPWKDAEECGQEEKHPTEAEAEKKEMMELTGKNCLLQICKNCYYRFV